MPKRRRKPPRQLSDFSYWIAPGVLGISLALLIGGFVHFTLIALDKQANFAPGSEHPDDWLATLCLVLALIALAGIFLSLREPTPMRWRRRRRISSTRNPVRTHPKRRRRSGTINLP